MDEKATRRDVIKGIAAAGAATALPTRLGAQEAGEKPRAIIVALVGCAHIHAPGFVKMVKSRQDVKVKYVYDHDQARAERNANELESKALTSPDEIWSDAQVSAVAIYSETDRHQDLVLAAAKARKPMFVEKPLGLGAKDACFMAEAIEKAGVPFTTGYAMRTTPQHLFIKDQIAKGNFGKITRVFASTCHDGSLGGWFDKDWRWMADPKIAGVGAFGDLGTHSLDLLMWLMGDVESVAADIKVVTGRYGDCDETGEALIRFKNGVIGTLAAAWVDVANPVSLMVSGTEGHAAIFQGQLYFKSKKVQGADGKKPWTELPPAQPHPVMMFLDTVAGKSGQPLVTPREAAARVSVMEAMYDASRQRKWVGPV
jgi:predicted dehydrogenase